MLLVQLRFKSHIHSQSPRSYYWHPHSLQILTPLCIQVGGDGLFQEAVNGLVQLRARSQKEGPAGQQAAALRLGHIPAGSTDAVAYSIHGTRDVTTAALHIVTGDRCTHA